MYFFRRTLLGSERNLPAANKRRMQRSIHAINLIDTGPNRPPDISPEEFSVGPGAKARSLLRTIALNKVLVTAISKVLEPGCRWSVMSTV